VLTLYLRPGLAARSSGRTNVASVMITTAYTPLLLQGDSLRNSISGFNCVYILNTFFRPSLMNLFLYAQRHEHLPYHIVVIQSNFQLHRPFYAPVSFIITHLHGSLQLPPINCVPAWPSHFMSTYFTTC